MNEIQKLCKLWCDWNCHEISSTDAMLLIESEKWFESVMSSEWAKKNYYSPVFGTKNNSLSETVKKEGNE